MNRELSSTLAGIERQPRILLVDDDEVNLLLTGAALRERGFTVHEASGGRAALGMLADWSPDVLVLDAVMPGMDGFRTCESLRDLPGFELERRLPEVAFGATGQRDRWRAHWTTLRADALRA